jgi:hypothetical protein
MITFQDYIPAPLPFYPDKDMQVPRMIFCTDIVNNAEVLWNYALYYENVSLDAFVYLPNMAIKRDAGGGPVTSFKIKRFLTDALVMTLDATEWEIHDIAPIENANGKELLIYTSTLFIEAISGRLSQGVPYYIEVIEDGNTWYSEVFFAKEARGEGIKFLPECEDQYRLVWNNGDCDIDNSFAGLMEYHIIARGVFSQPEYDKFEDSVKDADENDVLLFQRVQKIHRLEFICLEPMADALFSMQIYKNVSVEFPNGYTISAANIDVAVEPNDGCVFKVTVKFRNNVLRKTGCC